MKHEQQRIAAPDGVELHVESWSPDERPRFVVVIAHGNAEHIGRYARLALSLVERGGWVLGPDHRGQGRSGGRRGHIEAFEDYAADLRHIVARTRTRLPDLREIPWFLFGHSMGGLISLTYLLQYADDPWFDGAIVSSPLLGLTMKVSPLKRALGHVAARLAPGLTLPSGIPPEAICRDAQEVERYRNDDRRVSVVSAGWFAAMNRAIARVDRDAARISLPLLWYVGTADAICDHTVSERIFASLPEAGADRTFRSFEGYYHELHNEPEELRLPVESMIGDWIEARLKTRAS